MDRNISCHYSLAQVHCTSGVICKLLITGWSHFCMSIFLQLLKQTKIYREDKSQNNEINRRSETRYTAVLVINYFRRHPEESQNKNKQIWLVTLTTQTDDTAEASPCWVTVLFSLIGERLTAMIQDWQRKVWDSHTHSHPALLYSPSNHSRGL